MDGPFTADHTDHIPHPRAGPARQVPALQNTSSDTTATIRSSDEDKYCISKKQPFASPRPHPPHLALLPAKPHSSSLGVVVIADEHEHEHTCVLHRDWSFDSRAEEGGLRSSGTQDSFDYPHWQSPIQPPLPSPPLTSPKPSNSTLQRTPSARSLHSPPAKHKKKRPTTAPSDGILRSTNANDHFLNTDPSTFASSILPKLKMVKERRSLQQLLIPSFFQSPPTSPPANTGDKSFSASTSIPSSSAPSTKRNARSRAQTYSSGGLHAFFSTPAGGRAPSPAFPIDDDPFAPSPLDSTAPSSRASSIPATPVLTSPTLPQVQSMPMIESRNVESDSAATRAGSSSKPSPLNPKAISPTSQSQGTPPRTLRSKSYSHLPISPPQASSIPPLPTLPPKLSQPQSHSEVNPHLAVSTVSQHPVMVSTPSHSSNMVSPASAAPVRPHARPAYTRPAFAPRPSLPSLSTLARMDVPMSTLSSMFGVNARMKKRRGKVGGDLPLEPWNDQELRGMVVETSNEGQVNETHEANEVLDAKTRIVLTEKEEKDLPDVPVTPMRDSFDSVPPTPISKDTPLASTFSIPDADPTFASSPPDAGTRSVFSKRVESLESDNAITVDPNAPTPLPNDSTQRPPSGEGSISELAYLHSTTPDLNPVPYQNLTGIGNAEAAEKVDKNILSASFSESLNLVVDVEGAQTHITRSTSREKLRQGGEKPEFVHEPGSIFGAAKLKTAVTDTEGSATGAQAVHPRDINGAAVNEELFDDDHSRVATATVDTVPAPEIHVNVNVIATSSSSSPTSPSSSQPSASLLDSLTQRSPAIPIPTRQPSPFLPSPQFSIEDLGVVLSASPNFAQQNQARPESLTIDPGLPERITSLVTPIDREVPPVVEEETIPHSETAPQLQKERPSSVEEDFFQQLDEELELERHHRSSEILEEDDSSMLPPLSTLPEDDPVFSFSPPRKSIASDGSRASSWSRPPRSLHSRSQSQSDYGSSSGEDMPSLTSLPDPSLRGRQGSDSSISLSEISSYNGVAYTSSRSLKIDDTDFGMGLGLDFDEGPRAPRASHATIQSLCDDNELTIPYNVDELLDGWRPLDASTMGFEPGSSAGTLKPVPCGNGSRRRSASEGECNADEWAAGRSRPTTVTPLGGLVRSHTGDYNSRSGGGNAAREWGGSGYGYQKGYRGGAEYGNGGTSGFRPNGGSGGSDGRRGRDDGGDSDRDRRTRPIAMDSSSTSSESETESEDDYGEDEPTFAAAVAPLQPASSQRRDGRKGVYKPPMSQSEAPVTNVAQNSTGTTEDDDVPLAQRIPGALEAQKSIRRQAKSEREQKKRERSVNPSSRPRTQEDIPPLPSTETPERGRTITLRPPLSSAPPSALTGLSSSQEAALMAHHRALETNRVMPTRRARAKTLGEGNAGFEIDDLTRRLLRVQAQTDVEGSKLASSNAAPPPKQPSRTSDELRTSDILSSRAMNFPPVERSSAISSSSARTQYTPISPRSEVQQFQQMPGQWAEVKEIPVRGLRPMRSFHGSSNNAPQVQLAPVPLPRRPISSRGKQSEESHPSEILARRPTSSRSKHGEEPKNEEHVRNKLVKSTRPSLESSHPPKSNRTSAEDAMRRPDVPPLPTPHMLSPASASASPMRTSFPGSMRSQMRIFIGDQQKFNVVDIGPETNAKEILEMVQQQGELRREDLVSGNWMLFEICQDFGMERPVRNFELVADIMGSWNKDKTANCFMIKQTSFAPSLINVPASIPKRTGYVEYETKKGKWSKRWLELREHGLWLSKREGKDDEFLCSLSAFDAYAVTRIQKAPWNYVFAVKSTDPISLFENKADYLHVFSAPEDSGRQWVEKIMLARSYILFQEKNVLFRNKSSPQSATTSGAALSRAGTRKRPAQPFVNLASPFNMPSPVAQNSGGPFEPGSLLAKRTAEGA